MHFVLTLHSHLPYLLNHGRWPHGTDWLCEATLDTYLPLLRMFLDLEGEAVPAPVTLGITPVLANQLAHPSFAAEMELFFEQRLEACREAPSSLAATGDQHLLPLVAFWEDRFLSLRRLFREAEGDLVSAFRRLEEAGRIEIVASAATHGFLPLLGREESVLLQLLVGAREHRRLFGKAPLGCWVPECAYRPSGEWNPLPGVSRPAYRPGVETHLAMAGFRYFFLDTHMARAGESLGAYGDVPHGAERFDAQWEGRPSLRHAEAHRSPYQAFWVADDPSGPEVAAFVREPRSSMQVWSRHHGYPGDEWYLEFHKIRWPGGLKFWRVTGPEVDLGAKAPYDPDRARERVREHASHFAWLLGTLPQEERVARDGVGMAPFDTELFGHWWFEGVDFLAEVFRRIRGQAEVLPLRASDSLEASPPRQVIRPLEGSWGANGDFSMWLNPDTRWTWERLWPLEDRFWKLAPGARAEPALRPLLAQAARELLLAQSSDWQFMISTGAVPDYAERRFSLHCDDLALLLDALDPQAPAGRREEAWTRLPSLESRDDLFPEILEALDRVVEGVRRR